MLSPDVLDFPKLLDEIPGGNPAGDGDKNKFVIVRDALEKLRRQHDPSIYEDGTPEASMEKCEPNWPKLVNEAKTQLITKSKQVETAARLCEGLLMVHGFAGVRDGIKLLRLLFTDAWERMYPAIEDPDDGEMRTKWLDWLDPWDKGVCFPTSIRKSPMFGMLSYQQKRDGSADIETAVKSTDPARFQQLIADLTAAKQELAGLIAVAKEKVPTWSLSMGNVDTAITDCLTFAIQAQHQVGSSSDDQGGITADLVPGSEAGLVPINGRVKSVNVGASRDQIYKNIEMCADRLEKIEPHSPVPMLLRKVVNLGPMNFHKLVEELTRDQRVLDFLRPPEETPSY